MNNNEDKMEDIVKECIHVIESTNLNTYARTSYDISLVEHVRKVFIMNIQKRFNLIKTNY